MLRHASDLFVHRVFSDDRQELVDYCKTHGYPTHWIHRGENCYYLRLYRPKHERRPDECRSNSDSTP